MSAALATSLHDGYHVHRASGDTVELKRHDDHRGSRKPHAHGRWAWVQDVRTCCACFAPAALVREGDDEDGHFEVWRCVGGCGYLRSSTRVYRDRRYAGLSEIVLRDQDYAKASIARARVARG